jgi:hypothetical protein
MSAPTSRSLSKVNRTPLAETFRVNAEISLSCSSPADSITGSESGNRTAQRTSCRTWAGAGALGGSGESGFSGLIVVPLSINPAATVSAFIYLAYGTKVS